MLCKNHEMDETVCSFCVRCRESRNLNQQLSESQATVGLLVKAVKDARCSCGIYDPEEVQRDPDYDKETGHFVGCYHQRLSTLPSLITAHLKRVEALEEVAEAFEAYRYGQMSYDDHRTALGAAVVAAHDALSATESATGEKRDAGKGE